MFAPTTERINEWMRPLILASHTIAPSLYQLFTSWLRSSCGSACKDLLNKQHVAYSMYSFMFCHAYTKCWWNLSEFRDNFQKIDKFMETCRIICQICQICQILRNFPEICDTDSIPNVYSSIHSFIRFLTSAAQPTRNLLLVWRLGRPDVVLHPLARGRPLGPKEWSE